MHPKAAPSAIGLKQPQALGDNRKSQLLPWDFSGGKKTGLNRFNARHNLSRTLDAPAEGDIHLIDEAQAVN